MSNTRGDVCVCGPGEKRTRVGAKQSRTQDSLVPDVKDSQEQVALTQLLRAICRGEDMQPSALGDDELKAFLAW